MTEIFFFWTKRLSTIGAAEGTVGTGRGARGPPLLCARAGECADAIAAQHGVGGIGAWTRQTRVNQWRRINSGERESQPTFGGECECAGVAPVEAGCPRHVNAVHVVVEMKMNLLC